MDQFAPMMEPGEILLPSASFKPIGSVDDIDEFAFHQSNHKVVSPKPKKRNYFEFDDTSKVVHRHSYKCGTSRVCTNINLPPSKQKYNDWCLLNNNLIFV